jgi:thiol:disulfide interchange protein DsbD
VLLSSCQTKQEISYTEDEASLRSAINYVPKEIDIYFDLEKAKQASRINKKPILIIFHSHTCASFRETEWNFIERSKSTQQIKDQFIVLYLFNDANFIKVDPIPVQLDTKGDTIKTLGKRNLHYQIQKYQMAATPYYAIINADELDLATPIGYSKDTTVLKKFLQVGLNNYQK